MKIEASIRIIKALADESRLKIANSLMDKPQYVEEISQRIDLADSTVSFHLKKLEEAGLVSKRKEQYYITYSLNETLLNISLRDLISFSNDEFLEQVTRIEKYRQKVLRTFYRDGKLIQIPKQHKKRWIVFEEIVKKFEPGRVYEEKELNEVIMQFNEDYCTIRRELIGEKVLAREGNKYWLVTDNTGSGKEDFPLSFDHKTKSLKNSYRESISKFTK